MFRNAHLERLGRAFADQFSSDEHGFIYRKYQKGAPIRVSEMERDKFVANFNKRVRYATWSIFPATFGLILLVVWLVPNPDSSTGQIVVWVGIAAILLPFVAVYCWAWNAPSRELQRRTPEGAALTKEEARVLALSKITYGQLTVAALMGMGLAWKMSTKVDLFHGWGMIWLVFAAALIFLAGVQAIRKWRFNKP